MNSISDVYSMFGKKIKYGRLFLSDSVSVCVGEFLSMFEGANNYAEFIERDEYGFEDFFNRCKDEGILN